METKNLAALYDLAPLEWSGVVARLDRGYGQAPGSGGPNRHSTWLATIGPDGAPQLNGIGAQWHAGTFWFETGEHTRKGRNLARDPRCSLSVAFEEYDLVVEGEAHVVTDPATVAELAAVWRDGGWPCEVDESGTALTAAFSAPSAGTPPWLVYEVTIRSAVALQTEEPGGATRWTFG